MKLKIASIVVLTPCLLLARQGGTHSVIGRQAPTATTMRYQETKTEVQKAITDISARITSPAEKAQLDGYSKALTALDVKLSSPDETVRAGAVAEYQRILNETHKISTVYRKATTGQDKDTPTDTIARIATEAARLAPKDITTDDAVKVITADGGSYAKKTMGAALKDSALLKSLPALNEEDAAEVTKSLREMMYSMELASLKRSGVKLPDDLVMPKTGGEAAALEKALKSLLATAPVDMQRLRNLVTTVRTGRFAAVEDEYARKTQMDFAQKLAADAARLGGSKDKAAQDSLKSAVTAWALRLPDNSATPPVESEVRRVADKVMNAEQEAFRKFAGDPETLAALKFLGTDVFRSSENLLMAEMKADVIANAVKSGNAAVLKGLANLNAVASLSLKKATEKDGRAPTKLEQKEAFDAMANFFMTQLAAQDAPKDVQDAFAKIHTLLAPDQLQALDRNLDPSNPTHAKILDFLKQEIDTEEYGRISRRQLYMATLCKCTGQGQNANGQCEIPKKKKA
ncbi:hypothetical protein K2X33_00585 [bacterium]|nr:hypothetical protein [bacterium]